MVTELTIKQKNLYEVDYNLWLMDTVKNLELKDFQNIDVNNLIEEVLDLSRRSKYKIKNLLRRLFEHLLKLKYWKSEKSYNQNHWKKEIRNFRKQIKDELITSPSLKPYLREVFNECYQDATELVSDISTISLDVFPLQPIANIEQILDENWLP